MNRWRITIIVLVFASFFLLVARTWFGWEPWSSFRFLRDRTWLPNGTFVQHPWTLQSYPLLSGIGVIFTFYLSGILALFAFPGQIRRMEQALEGPSAGLLRLLLIGLVTGILIAVIAISSALMMGTFPLTIFLGSILFLSGFVGYVALAYALGHALFVRAAWGRSPMYSLLLGLLILFALGEIPLAGIILKVIFASLSVGVVIATRFGTGRPWNLSPLWEE
jgi:hypothetical protein